MKIFLITADYRNPPQTHPYAVRARNKKEARAYFSRKFTWLKIYGMNSIVAYTVGETIDFRSIVSSVSYGLAPLLGEYYDTWLTFGNFAILLFILTIMYRSKTYIKI